jgi:cytochrome bd-type quinol oxidase subunit 1/mono/diheme cytochrome c family protein
MNYPIWEVPSGGLLIAFVAIVHVLVAHFAVGGGLFLVLAEMKARREQDGVFLDYLKRHSRFFILLTLVFGALTGVGIWFTITLVHPQATSSLINTFVWGWAMEWCFFIIEIAAAMVYYYGWERMDARTHVAVGWIYFIAAWISLVIINGILSYMLTPGAWVTDRAFWSGFFNPTYWPSMIMRTFVAMGLAGIYALLTASWSRSPDLKRKIARYASLYWVLPMAVAVPVGLIWYLLAAASAGVPVAEMMQADGNGLGALITAIFIAGTETGQPVVQRAAFYGIVASVLVILLTLSIATFRKSSYGRVSTVVLLLLALVAMGGGEWMRESMRKPYVIGKFMFVNGVRLPAAEGLLNPPPEAAWQAEDRFSVDSLNENGVLQTALWTGLPEGEEIAPAGLDPAARAERQAEAGREMFKLTCSACHTLDGYLAIRPLVRDQSVASLDRIISNLARPVDEAGNPTSWSDPDLRLATWRGRRMPPFVGTEAERRALAIYLSRVGGTADAGVEAAVPETVAPGSAVPAGLQIFDDYCSICHEPGGDWPMEKMIKGRDADTLYRAIGRLPELNEDMPPFEGTVEERRALADYLAGLGQDAAPTEDQP